MSHHFIRFTKVSYTYADKIKALENISFLITHGEKVALIGANGAGKSTVLLATCGIYLPQSGEINIGDIPLEKSTLPLIRRKVGLIFQNPDEQLFMPTVEQDVAFGPQNMSLPLTEVERRVEKSLKETDCYELRQRAPYHLSGGQKRSVAIAGILAMEPEILLMDEPTSNLDSHSRRLLINQINSFTHTCLIATHDLDFVCETCHRCIVLKEGKILRDGSTKEIFKDVKLLEQALLEQPSRAKAPYF